MTRTAMISSVVYVLLCSFLLTSAQTISPINTTSGLVVGNILENQVREWLSIPYAVPPVGDRRFKPPLPLPPSSSVVNNGSSLLPICPQRLQPYMLSRYQETEDCLVLNIWAPLTASSSPKPVVVFIHGGSFNSGMGSMYNGSDWSAREDIVIVTLNYRLSVLGFISIPALVSESKENGGKGEGVGMFGLLDQQLALRWVKDNIALFGGLPNQVTIYGESAGAASVSAQLAIPSSRGLFNAAISSSTYAAAFFDSQFAQIALWNSIVNVLNCSSSDYKMVLACLRNVSFEQLNEFHLLKNYTGVTPVCPDGVILPDLPYSLFRRKLWNNVPVLFGSNSHEMSTLLRQTNQVDCSFYDNPIALNNTAITINSTEANDILSLYPVDLTQKYPYYEKVVEMLSDQGFRCPAASILRFIQNTKVPSFLYSWEVFPSWIYPACLKDGHATELPYVFPSLLSSNWSFIDLNTTSNYINLTSGEVQASHLFQKIMANFARSFNPSFTWNNDNVTWPQFNALQLPYVKLSLDDSKSKCLYSTETNYRDGKCKHWDMGFFIDNRVQWTDLPVGDYYNPKQSNTPVAWSRSPCPALNTLANHGYLRRDGSKIYREDLVSAIFSVFHIDMGFIFDTVVSGPGKNGGKFGKVDPTNNLTYFDLGDLAQHSPFVCEHDASLSRLDAQFGNQNEFNEAYFNQFINLASGDQVTYETIANARVMRINQCHKYNQNCSIGVTQQAPGVLEGALVLKAFSSGNDACPVSNVKSFFIDEKIPSNFTWPPKELLVVDLFGPVSLAILNLMAVSTVQTPPIPGVPDNTGENEDTYSKTVVYALIITLAIVGLVAIVLLIALVIQCGKVPQSSTSSPYQKF